mgnify:FL=1
MKKIFIIEINEKDKNLDNYEAVMALDKDIKEFADRLRSNDNIYVQLKRSGSIWRNILDNIQEKFNNKSDNDSNDDSNDDKNRKINHLKLIK